MCPHFLHLHFNAFTRPKVSKVFHHYFNATLEILSPFIYGKSPSYIFFSYNLNFQIVSEVTLNKFKCYSVIALGNWKDDEIKTKIKEDNSHTYLRKTPALLWKYNTKIIDGLLMVISFPTFHFFYCFFIDTLKSFLTLLPPHLSMLPWCYLEMRVSSELLQNQKIFWSRTEMSQN